MQWRQNPLPAVLWVATTALVSLLSWIDPSWFTELSLSFETLRLVIKSFLIFGFEFGSQVTPSQTQVISRNCSNNDYVYVR